MQLLQSPASPFVRMVRTAILETGLSEQITQVDIATTPLASDATLVAVNPVGKIPSLVRADGPALYDSRVICRYLDAYAQSDLYPQVRLWDTLTLEATGHGIAEAAVSMVYEKRFRTADQVSPDWIEAQWSKIDRALDALDQRWISHLHGPLDMGQIAIGCALGYLDFRLSDRDWRNGRADLAAWQAHFATRPAMSATAPDA